VLPDAFFALDGLYETTFAVLRDFGVFPAMLEAELQRYLPFLATTGFLVLGVRSGLPREQAHEVIKEHAVAVALAAREGSATGMDLVERLDRDPRFPADGGELAAVVDRPERFLGLIDEQISAFVRRVQERISSEPDASYRGRDIL
jgi:adenylosuccinate lyase